MASALNEVRRLFNGLTQPNVLHQHAKQFSAGLVIFDNSKAQRQGIERSRSEGLVSDRLQIRQRLSEIFHHYLLSASGLPKVAKIFLMGPIRPCSIRLFLFNNAGRLNIVEARELFFQIGVSFAFDFRLVGHLAVA